MRDEPGIALIGTLDTKGDEIAYVRERLATLGARPVVIDSGILGEPGTVADIAREEVAREAGHELEEIQEAGSRGAAVELMQEGVRAVVIDIDGTMTDYKRHLDWKGVEAVRHVEAAGTPVLAATGNVGPVTKAFCDYVGTSGPAVCENGGVVYDRTFKQRKVLAGRRHADRAVKFLRRKGFDAQYLASDPWRVVLSTDHPNGGSFRSYPELIRLLPSLLILHPRQLGGLIAMLLQVGQAPPSHNDQLPGLSPVLPHGGRDHLLVQATQQTGI